ncbi:MAG: hypothetical protein MRERV_10c050 [Mycoplasmataceae bacterium RV_VA103A]|nr:MAG: hypothetical protein MRERV_10c050 [Mycoplasmataceae bacterium RV_VA103A]
MKKNLKKIKAVFSKSRDKKQKINKSNLATDNSQGISDLGLHNHPAEKNLVETENSFSEISKTTKIFNIKENNMTEPNNNNSNLITNEQPSLTTSSVDTREGNLNMGNQVKGNNANLSSNRRSTEYSGHFHFTGSKSQNVLGNDNKLTQNNNEVDNEGKVVVARLKRETLVKDAMTKLAQDLDSIKILFEILPTVKEKVKQEVEWEYDFDLYQKVASLESKLANVREICQAQAEETRLEIKIELLAQQEQN